MKPIILEVVNPLIAISPEQELWAHWFEQNTSLNELLPSSFRASTGLKAPAFSSEISFPEVYADALIDDLDSLIPEEKEHALVKKSLVDLKTGKARAVVTGQQPAFAGGPMYSLFKIATTVALAGKYTQQGQPTVPVFWMGDDDDDWREMLDPVYWDQNSDQLISSHLKVEKHSQRQPMIGTVAVAELDGSFWPDHPQKSRLGNTLQSIWKECSKEGRTLSDFTERILREVFKGSGLVILRGNDPRLHSAGKSFYAEAFRQMPEISRRVLQQGEALESYGLSQLSTNSIERPLYTVENGFRRPLNQETLPENTAHLRCGVLLRALLQDWLLRPSAVVVGPGELAYLAQILPAYECLGLQRSPLVPRMFGWVAGFDLSVEDIRRFTSEKPLPDKKIQSLAEVAGSAGEEKLVAILRKELALDEDRAVQLAAGRTRRWVKGVKALMKSESQKQYLLNRPDKPRWAFPEGKRQERKLAWIPLVSCVGESLVYTIQELASLHLSSGAQGKWHDYLIRISDYESN